MSHNESTVEDAALEWFILRSAPLNNGGQVREQCRVAPTLTRPLPRGEEEEREAIRRLKNPDQPFDYFGELMRRIQDIRTSGRRFYQKITDIDARSQFCSKRARGATTPHGSGHTPNPEAWFTSTIKTVAEPAPATFSTILRVVCKPTATKCTRHWALTG